MRVPESVAPQRKADPAPAEISLEPQLSPTQRQILQLLAQGDCLWEIADDADHYTVYNEKRGGDQRVRATTVKTLEKHGWIRKRPNPQADRLDSWEITPKGQALLPRPKVRHRRSELSPGVSPSE
jgi:hypothetical protein